MRIVISVPFSRKAARPDPGLPTPKPRRRRKKNLVPLGPLVWKKTLTSTDAQRQTGNPTGDLRLTKAGYKVDGVLIDHTRYFRDEVFVACEWVVESSTPLVEVATVMLAVHILGVDYGVVPLLVSHKPSGEAGQHNYTTGLRWGPLLGVLRGQRNLTGRTLSLYAPALSADDPFVVTVT
ncbi:MAG TPA: hypothetical protein VMT19_00020 [Thermoanaerobaculaceae bacterium]|nr:hypothetical protein [Thermoanaerobaculaceae bacterium]